MSNDSSPLARTAVAHCFYIVQHMNQALVEAEIAKPALELAVLDQEGAVTGHAGKIFSYGSTSRMYQSRVTRMPRSVDAIICVDGLSARGRAGEDNVHGHFAHIIGNGKAMAGGFDRANLVGEFGMLASSPPCRARIPDSSPHRSLPAGTRLRATPSPSKGAPDCSG